MKVNPLYYGDFSVASLLLPSLVVKFRKVFVDVDECVARDAGLFSSSNSDTDLVLTLNDRVMCFVKEVISKDELLQHAQLSLSPFTELFKTMEIHLKQCIKLKLKGFAAITVKVYEDVLEGLLLSIAELFKELEVLQSGDGHGDMVNDLASTALEASEIDVDAAGATLANNKNDTLTNINNTLTEIHFKTAIEKIIRKSFINILHKLLKCEDMDFINIGHLGLVELISIASFTHHHHHHHHHHGSSPCVSSSPSLTLTSLKRRHVDLTHFFPVIFDLCRKGHAIDLQKYESIAMDYVRKTHEVKYGLTWQGIYHKLLMDPKEEYYRLRHKRKSSKIKIGNHKFADYEEKEPIGDDNCESVSDSDSDGDDSDDDLYDYSDSEEEAEENGTDNNASSEMNMRASINNIINGKSMDDMSNMSDTGDILSSVGYFLLLQCIGIMFSNSTDGVVLRRTLEPHLDEVTASIIGCLLHHDKRKITVPTRTSSKRTSLSMNTIWDEDGASKTNVAKNDEDELSGTTLGEDNDSFTFPSLELLRRKQNSPLTLSNDTGRYSPTAAVYRTSIILHEDNLPLPALDSDLLEGTSEEKSKSTSTSNAVTESSKARQVKFENNQNNEEDEMRPFDIIDQHDKNFIQHPNRSAKKSVIENNNNGNNNEVGNARDSTASYTNAGNIEEEEHHSMKVKFDKDLGPHTYAWYCLAYLCRIPSGPAVCAIAQSAIHYFDTLRWKQEDLITDFFLHMIKASSGSDVGVCPVEHLLYYHTQRLSADYTALTSLYDRYDGYSPQYTNDGDPTFRPPNELGSELSHRTLLERFACVQRLTKIIHRVIDEGLKNKIIILYKNEKRVSRMSLIGRRKLRSLSRTSIITHKRMLSLNLDSSEKIVDGDVSPTHSAKSNTSSATGYSGKSTLEEAHDHQHRNPLRRYLGQDLESLLYILWNCALKYPNDHFTHSDFPLPTHSHFYDVIQKIDTQALAHLSHVKHTKYTSHSKSRLIEDKLGVQIIDETLANTYECLDQIIEIINPSYTEVQDILLQVLLFIQDNTEIFPFLTRDPNTGRFTNVTGAILRCRSVIGHALNKILSKVHSLRLTEDMNNKNNHKKGNDRKVDIRRDSFEDEYDIPLPFLLSDEAMAYLITAWRSPDWQTVRQFTVALINILEDRIMDGIDFYRERIMQQQATDVIVTEGISENRHDTSNISDKYWWAPLSHVQIEMIHDGIYSTLCAFCAEQNFILASNWTLHLTLMKAFGTAEIIESIPFILALEEYWLHFPSLVKSTKHGFRLRCLEMLNCQRLHFLSFWFVTAKTYNSGALRRFCINLMSKWATLGKLPRTLSLNMYEMEWTTAAHDSHIYSGISHEEIDDLSLPHPVDREALFQALLESDKANMEKEKLELAFKREYTPVDPLMRTNVENKEINNSMVVKKSVRISEQHNKSFDDYDDGQEAQENQSDHSEATPWSLMSIFPTLGLIGRDEDFMEEGEEESDSAKNDSFSNETETI